jgi:hypothetical protein
MESPRSSFPKSLLFLTKAENVPFFTRDIFHIIIGCYPIGIFFVWAILCKALLKTMDCASQEHIVLLKQVNRLINALQKVELRFLRVF